MMKKCYLDSNLLIYYKDQDSPFHLQAKNIIKKLNPTKYQLYISSLVIDEVLYSFRKIMLYSRLPATKIYKELNKLITSILTLEHLNIINPPSDKTANKKVVEIMRNFNLLPRDAYHLLIMQEHGIKNFATFDKDFQKVFGNKILKLIV